MNTLTVPKLHAADEDWVDDAACRDEDPELFFPISFTGPSAGQVKAAKAVCARCAVRDACLSTALHTGQAYGVWGGTTPDERRAIRRNPVIIDIMRRHNIAMSTEEHRFDDVILEGK